MRHTKIRRTTLEISKAGFTEELEWAKLCRDSPKSNHMRPMCGVGSVNHAQG